MLRPSHAQPGSVLQKVIARAPKTPRCSRNLLRSQVPRQRPMRNAARTRRARFVFPCRRERRPRRRIRAGSAAKRLPWCRATLDSSGSSATPFFNPCSGTTGIAALRRVRKCRPQKGVAFGHFTAAEGRPALNRASVSAFGFAETSRTGSSPLWIARAREREAVSATSRGPRPGTPTRHPLDPGNDPECIVFARSENALRIMPPLAARCRHGSRVGISPLSGPDPTHRPKGRRESRSQTWWVCQTQRGVRERVGPTGHHDPHPPGNLACSAPCPLRVHECRPALECPRCIEEIAEERNARSLLPSTRRSLWRFWGRHAPLQDTEQLPQRNQYLFLFLAVSTGIG